MKQTKDFIVTLMVFFGMGSIGLCTEPFAVGPYLGQTPPGPVAQVFAPGLISDTRPQVWESNGNFSADGNTFCYVRNSVHRSPGEGSFFITENTNQGWTAPKLIASIREEHAAWGPCLSPDANSIYFTFAFVEPVSKRNIYRSDRTAHGWTEPQSLGPPLSSPDPELTCSIAANNSIYILRGGRDGVFCAPYENGTWSRVINIPVKGCDPGPAPDESFMVVADKDKPGGYGHFDLNLILRLPDGTWSIPRNLGPKVNSSYIEFGPRISPDKKYLFFNRSNGWDPRKHSVRSYIYWVELKEYLPESYR
ncbi:MAG: PD40 domain-containing protein [Sedimentisphaerales bacterium]|nr:PD40 domain-containing protein [Sedimentisphaerales bacterium]